MANTTAKSKPSTHISAAVDSVGAVRAAEEIIIPWDPFQVVLKGGERVFAFVKFLMGSVSCFWVEVNHYGRC